MDLPEDFTFAPLIWIGVILGVYFVPSVVAFWRQHPNRWPILIVNLAFGATVVGWFGALIWAAHAVHRPADISASRGGESGLNLEVNDPVRIQMQLFESGTSHRISISEAVTRLQKLEELLTRDAISKAEFDELKAKILRAT